MGDKKKQIEQRRRKNKAKKSAKNILVVGVFTLLGSLLLFASIFYFYSLKTLGVTSYPSSPLSKMMDASYSYVTNTSLPIVINSPNLPYSLSVSGEERYINYNGTVFYYGNELYISIYEVYGTPLDILNNQLAYDLYAGELMDTPFFLMDNEDVGYFNGFPAAYICGDCQILSPTEKVLNNIYVVSMTLDTGYDGDLMIAVSTTNDKNLYDAGVLLQNIGYTVMDTSQTRYLDGTSPTKNTVVVEETINGEVDPLTETVSESKDVDSYSEVSKSSLAGNEMSPDTSQWDSYYVTLPQMEEEVDFILSYTEKKINPTSAIIYSPDGMDTYSANYFNDGKDGRIYFSIMNADAGQWTIRILTSADLGSVSADYEVVVGQTDVLDNAEMSTETETVASN